MSVSKQRTLLLHFNRSLIYIFALLGLFYDFTWAYVISLTLWVWLPLCIRAERQLISNLLIFTSRH